MTRPIMLLIFFIVIACIMISGCAVGFYKGRPSDKATIEELRNELESLRQARSAMADKLRSEIDSDQIALSMDDRGIIITFVAEVLFDSGKADLKPAGMNILNKVAGVIKEEAASNEIGIEGHTDNVPITRSGWESNWDLSAARATSVLHYLESKCGIAPEKLSATGYGEYRPVASNSTSQGRQANRRVEIIIKPVLDAKIIQSPAAMDSEYIK